MKRLLLTLYDLLEKHRVLCIGVLIGLVAVMCAATLHLHTSEDIADFLPANSRMAEVRQLLGRQQEAGKVIVYITPNDTTGSALPERSIEVMEALIENIDSLCQPWIKELFYQVDMATMTQVADFVSSHLPYFLTDADYARMDTLLSPSYIQESVTADRKKLLSGEGMVVRNVLLNDPLHFSAPAFKELQRYASHSAYESYDGYLFSDGWKTQWLIISTALSDSQTGVQTSFASQLQKAVGMTLSTYGKDYRIKHFSAAEVAQSNADRIKRDSLIALALSTLLILLLLWAFFHHLKALLVIMASVGFGALFSLSLIAVSGHTVSLIAIGAGSIILGIAIDYSLHFITHYKFSGSARTALAEIVEPITIGSVTTIAAFFSLLFIQAPAMRDLGLFAGLALIGTIVFVLLFLPHFMPHRAPDLTIPAFFQKSSDFRPENRPLLTVSIVVITLVLAIFAQRMRFDTDLHHINYMTEAEREAFQFVQAHTATSPNSCYIALRANDMEGALHQYEALDSTVLQPALQRGDIADLQGIARFLPSQQEQQRRLQRWLQWCHAHGGETSGQLAESARKAGFKQLAFQGFTSQITDRFDLLDYDDFAPLTTTVLQPYCWQDSSCCVLAQVTCHDAAGLQSFMSGLPEPVIAFTPSSLMNESVETLGADFDFVLWMCGCIVLLFLLLSFGRPEVALISFLPMSVSWIWILGIMGLLDIPFNVVNIILATFIFGLGDDYAIFMMDGLIQEYSYGKRMLGIHKNAVLLSVLTLLAGIGTLIFAAHPAMRSLANVTFIGMLSVLLITYLIPPILFHALTVKHQAPVTLQRFCYSVATETLFISSALALSLGAMLCFLFVKPTEERRLRLHRYMHKVTGFIVRHIAGAPFQLGNPHNETFDRPAVIIANHQSRLDLMAMISLTPKLVILTNNWVWNNPIYGRLIHYAEFYPVSEGFESMLPRMQSLIDRGYSVVVFPEGTRSADCRIGKFHQGAYQLARALHVDLLPIVLHGFGHVLPKKNLALRKGRLYLEIGARQPYCDQPGDATCRKAAKASREFFVSQYKRICREREDAAYWFPYVCYQYYYKDRVVLALLHGYKRDLSPISEAVGQARGREQYHLSADDYGIMALTVALCAPDTQVFAETADKQAWQMATHLTCLPDNLHFILQDS